MLADALWEPGDMSVSQEGEMLPVPLPAALFSASPRFRSAAPTSHQLQDPELLSVLKLRTPLDIAEPPAPTILFPVLQNPAWLCAMMIARFYRSRLIQYV